VEKQTVEWRLDVYGDGDRTDYERLIDEFSIDRERCRLHGRTNDVEREYCNSSIFVLSSRFEGFGLVIVEAMSCGLPVVAFDCPWGPRSIIKDGEDGLLVENGNIDKLSEAVVSLIQDEKNLRRMACNAIDNVQRFNIEQVALRWKSLFESV
jgi:glycosyltransferase involved in cell wall biosynthesis